MFTQEDLEFARVGGQKRLMVAVSLGQSYDDVRSLTEGLRNTLYIVNVQIILKTLIYIVHFETNSTN